MAAIEALQLDAAYVAVAKSLGLPTPVVHGPLGRADPRRPGRRRDVRERADRGARRASTASAAPACSTSCWSSACPSSSSTTRCAARRCASCARSGPVDDLPVRAAHRPAHGRPAPDHGRAHDGALADRAVPAVARRRSRQPRELDQGRRQGHLPARLRRGGPRGSRATARSRRTRRSTPSCGGSSGRGLVDQTELPFIPPAAEPTAEALAAGSGPARRRNARRAG